MTSEELAEFVEGEIRRQRERILGVGKEQYSEEGQPQLFETMPMGKLFEYAREEIDDIVVYALMLKIRLNRLEEQIFQGTLGWDPDHVSNRSFQDPGGWNERHPLDMD